MKDCKQIICKKIVEMVTIHDKIGVLLVDHDVILLSSTNLGIENENEIEKLYEYCKLVLMKENFVLSS